MKKIQKNKLFFCATEQSGDNIGVQILSKLNKKKNKYIFDGVGGNKMSPYLRKEYFSLKDFKSIGIIEIIGSIIKYLSMIEKLSDNIIKKKYKIVVTIDSPDFNYRLAKKIRTKGYTGKIIHVVSPTVWAWRKNRAKEFAKIFNKILLIFPFEKKIFNKYNLETKFIGHPIYYIKNIKNNFNKKYIAFLPGSRENEILSLIKYYEIISNYLIKNSFKYRIFIPTLPHLKKKLLNLTKNWKYKPIIETNHINIEKKYSQTSIAVVCSGTATLEITRRKIPQLIIYKLNFLTEIILKIFAYIKYANIINIMANKIIIPELINSNLNEKTILKEFKLLLNNYLKKNNLQIKHSEKYLKKLMLKKSPGDLASKEIEKLFLP